MTLEQAKEIIAKKYQFDNWKGIDKNGEYLTPQGLMSYEQIADEAAEFYADQKILRFKLRFAIP